jgi:CheY-like chemotaxis protein
MTTRIMVIDDEPLICTLLEYQLGGAGYAVTSFQRGEEALLRLAHEQPDLILLDVMMPEISGWDLCRQIRASSSVPVIMLTAKQGDDDVVAGLTSGADDYVGKPFHQGQLVARIEAVLRRAPARSARPGAPPARPAPAPDHVAPAPPPLPQPPAAAAAAPAPPAAPPAPPPRPAPAPQRLGPRLAAARRERGLSLHDAGQHLGIRWEFLQAIEQEEFGYVPRPALRQALQGYSAMLGVDLAPYTGRRRRRALRPSSLSLTVVLALTLALAIVLLAMAL